MPSRVSGAWQPISLFVIGTVVVCPTHPHPPKLPVHNRTTPWLDFRRHKQAGEMERETVPETQGAGTQIEVESFSPPKQRVLRNPVGEGVGQRYHSSAS